MSSHCNTLNEGNKAIAEVEGRDGWKRNKYKRKERECRNWRAKRDETQERIKTTRQEGDRRGAKETKQGKNGEMRQKKIQRGGE